MTYNIVGHQREPDYLQYLVEELSDSKFPHDIPNTFEFAQIQVEKLSQIIAKVKKGMKTMTNLGHMEILDSGASGAVNFVMGLSGKDVGVAYKERVVHGIYAVSVRGSKNCKVHLGKLLIFWQLVLVDLVVDMIKHVVQLFQNQKLRNSLPN